VNTEPPTTLLRLYDRLTGLLEKLPGGLQKPVLRELQPIRDLFLDTRPPRLMLVGDSTSSAPTLLAALGVANIHTGESLSGWRAYSIPTGAEIQILDARNDVPAAHIEQALAHSAPDLVLVVEDDTHNPPGWKTTLERAALSTAPVIGLSPQSGFQSRLADLLHAEPDLSARHATTLAASDPTAPEILCAALPATAQLAFARFTHARRAQALIASSLLKSFSGLCGLIGMQPIPLADLPLLLTLQSLMVGLIIHTTGRRVNARLITEFLGALGLGAAAGFAFREAARIAVKIVPFWGHAVSGLVAGAGTYAIGRAAIAYFIDDAPLAETRRLFRKMLRTRKP
jgi:uncharacterized protein (DUF697 family)